MINTWINWLLGMLFGLISGWIITYTYFSNKVRKVKIESWDKDNEIWDDLFNWTNLEMVEMETSKEFSPQAKVLYHNVLLKFQSKIREEKLKTSRIRK